MSLRGNDQDDGADRGDLEDKVTQFGSELSELSDKELERRAEEYLNYEGSWTASGGDSGGN